MEVTSSGLASYPQPGSPQADSMVLFGAFCNFLCTKKIRKKLFQNDLNECIFVYVHEKEAIQKCEQGRLLCWIKTGKLVCLVAFCVFRLFLFLFFLSFNFFYYYYFFLLSLLHHNKTFSTNIHRGTHREKKSSCRCNDEAKPFTCTALRSMALASVRPADMVLRYVPPPFEFQLHLM